MYRFYSIRPLLSLSRLWTLLLLLFCSLSSIEYASAQNGSFWNAQSVGVGNDNKPRLLWTLNGRMRLWTINTAGQVESSVAEGPYTNLTPHSVMVFGDGRSCVFWQNSNGGFRIRLMTPTGALGTRADFAPLSDSSGLNWRALSACAGRDNKIRVMWRRADNKLAIWIVDSTLKYQSRVDYGPYPGWTPIRIRIDGNNASHIHWLNSSGTLRYWVLNPALASPVVHDYGPYTDKTLHSLGAGGTGSSVGGWTVWNYIDTKINLWKMSATGVIQSNFNYGPYAGLAMKNIAVKSDGRALILWQNSNGGVELWTISASGTRDKVDSYNYPPSLVTTAKTSQIILSWNPILNATSYRVYRSSSNTGPFTLLGSTAGTSYTDNNVSAGTTYFYKVASVTGSIESIPVPVKVTSISSFLATPASGYQYLIPICVISYLPTVDNVNLDQSVTGTGFTLTDIKTKMDRVNKQVKFAMEEGSKYHGYKNPSALPSLGYKVVSWITVHEKLPRSNYVAPKNDAAEPTSYYPDYRQILTRLNAQKLVNNDLVKEFWLWGYHYGDIKPAEANMSSPVSPDVSNSSQVNDLPIFNHTYTVYNYTFGLGGQVGAPSHTHNHQMELVFEWIAKRQDGNDDLFWKNFVGRTQTRPQNIFQKGRCGCTHITPNTGADGQYANTTPAQSDIENWTPGNIGQKTSVNVYTWRNKDYKWPDGLDPSFDVLTGQKAEVYQILKDEAQWEIYWMQNVPGRSNNIAYGGSGQITNWWQFIGDWDNAIPNGTGLHTGATQSFGIQPPSNKSRPSTGSS